MAKNTKSTRRSATYTLGRKGFAKISAVEGIRASRRVEEDFREFDRKGLPAEERRKQLTEKYGRKG